MRARRSRLTLCSSVWPTQICPSCRRWMDGKGSSGVRRWTTGVVYVEATCQSLLDDPPSRWALVPRCRARSRRQCYFRVSFRRRRWVGTWDLCSYLVQVSQSLCGACALHRCAAAPHEPHHRLRADGAADWSGSVDAELDTQGACAPLTVAAGRDRLHVRARGDPL